MTQDTLSYDSIMTSPTVDSGGVNSDGVSTRLTVFASPSLNQDQLWRLFDLIPGLDYCDLRKDRKSGQVATIKNKNQPKIPPTPS